MATSPLGPILCATFTAPDPDISAAHYVEHLDQVLVAQEPLSTDLAQSWGAPCAARRPTALLRPRSAEPGWIRIVGGESAAPPLSTFGWLAMEILVKDTDVLSKRLRDTPFHEIGAPHDLGVVKGVRAMQAVGAAGEVVYLTERDEVARFRSRFVMGDVDRIFIMVLGARDFDTSKAFYEEHFALPVGVSVNASQALKVAALGVPADRKYRMLTFVLAGGQEVVGKIQLDAHPAEASPQPRNAGDLPAGIALVTFEVPSFDGISLPFIAPPRIVKEPPYDGRCVATCVGPSGELIELAARG